MVELRTRRTERQIHRQRPALERVRLAAVHDLLRERQPLAARLLVVGDDHLFFRRRRQGAVGLPALVRLRQVRLPLLHERGELGRADLSEDHRSLGDQELLQIAIGFDDGVDGGKANTEEIGDAALDDAGAQERGEPQRDDERDHHAEAEGQACVESPG